MAANQFYSLPRRLLLRLSEPLRDTLSNTSYAPPEGASISIKSLLHSLLPRNDSVPSKEEEFRKEVRDFLLFCVAIASAEGDESPTLFWIPKGLILAAKSALGDFSRAVSFPSEREMVAAALSEVLPMVKGIIKDTCVDTEEDDVVAASGKAPVAYAVVAAHQFRWLVSQVVYPDLGNLLWLVAPCALTALDHWSAEVKEQGIAIVLHTTKHVNAAELSWYEEAILDACCRNIPAADELWHCVIEVSVVFLMCTQRMNPRSSWFDRMLNEMLCYLERQPFNRERRVAWLLLIEPVFETLGLFILAHFRRIFALFFQWMHADDEKTVLLVLERLHTIIKLTWMRKSPYFERLVDELVILYKESAIRKDREVLRGKIFPLLVLLQKCKGTQFESAWVKHQNDMDLVMLVSSFSNLLTETP